MDDGLKVVYSLLRQKLEDWRVAMEEGNLMRAAYMANDVESLCLCLLKETYSLLEEKDSAKASPKPN